VREGVAALEFFFVKPNFEPGRVEPGFGSFRRLEVFARVADEDRASRRLERERRRHGLRQRRAALGPARPKLFDKLHRAALVAFGLFAEVTQKDQIWMIGNSAVGEVFGTKSGYREGLIDAQPEEPREPVGKRRPEDQEIILPKIIEEIRLCARASALKGCTCTASFSSMRISIRLMVYSFPKIS
jgi:hypothetical protein